jgi:hypothetical protein
MIDEPITYRQFMQRLENVARRKGTATFDVSLQLGRTDKLALECLQKILDDYGELTVGEIQGMLTEMDWWWRMIAALHTGRKWMEKGMADA